jgi:ATP-dependent Lhr-like helicase
VIFRDLLARETLAPPWRELLTVLRRKEAQGEIRGGRFVSGFSGEQFARPEALDLLRAVRRSNPAPDDHPNISNADPLNLAGIILPGPRVSTLLRDVVKHPDISHYAGMIESGDPRSSQSIDDVVYGSRD